MIAGTVGAADHALLPAIALRSIAAALRARARPPLTDLDHVARLLTGPIPEHLRAPGASFVTLERDGDLLGCIGALEPARPLALDVAAHAVAAAFDDPRLPAVTPDDFPLMAVKVSVLSPLQPLPVASYGALVAAVQPGIDGVLVETGPRRATFLPSVWPKLPDPAAFVGALWAKAGLAPGAWPHGLAVRTYTAAEVIDAGPRGSLAATD